MIRSICQLGCNRKVKWKQEPHLAGLNQIYQQASFCGLEKTALKGPLSFTSFIPYGPLQKSCESVFLELFTCAHVFTCVDSCYFMLLFMLSYVITLTLHKITRVIGFLLIGKKKVGFRSIVIGGHITNLSLEMATVGVGANTH